MKLDIYLGLFFPFRVHVQATILKTPTPRCVPLLASLLPRPHPTSIDWRFVRAVRANDSAVPPSAPSSLPLREETGGRGGICETWVAAWGAWWGKEDGTFSPYAIERTWCLSFQDPSKCFVHAISPLSACLAACLSDSHSSLTPHSHRPTASQNISVTTPLRRSPASLDEFNQAIVLLLRFGGTVPSAAAIDSMNFAL
jgi:hypothetical protein